MNIPYSRVCLRTGIGSWEMEEGYTEGSRQVKTIGMIES